MSKGRLSSLIWRIKMITYLIFRFQMILMWNILTIQIKTHKTIKPTVKKNTPKNKAVIYATSLTWTKYFYFFLNFKTWNSSYIIILQKYVFCYFHFFHGHLFQHHSDEKTFLGCSNSPQSLDVAVLFLTTFV